MDETKRHFNLIDDDWIKVLDMNNCEQTISLKELFANSANYRKIAGEMASQDVAILRLVEAILTTVYSRFDADGTPYDWLDVDEVTMIAKIGDDFDEEDAEEALVTTWQKLSQNQQFSQIVLDYLRQYHDCFDFFDEKTPFYQVTQADYDALVSKGKATTTGKGTVAVKQINRLISESNNKPNVFSPKTNERKNQMKIDELVRWVICYQNFTGTTDKTKVVTKEKFSSSKGWLYGLNPVFATGSNLFETLMLNLVLVPKRTTFELDECVIQQPIWEQKISDYVAKRIEAITPTNIAAIYTQWSRILHFEWDEDTPKIFSATLPKMDNANAFIEPMTTWRYHKKDNVWLPAIKTKATVAKAMWRNFGQYVAATEKDEKLPGVVAWLKFLKQERVMKDVAITLKTAGLISDGNPTSQLPVMEYCDDIKLDADILLDETQRAIWLKGIETTISRTEELGAGLYSLALSSGKLSGMADAKPLANQLTAQFYANLNQPFLTWLSSLTAADEPNERMQAWLKTAYRLVMQAETSLKLRLSPQALRGGRGDGKVDNFFVAEAYFFAKIKRACQGN